MNHDVHNSCLVTQFNARTDRRTINSAYHTNHIANSMYILYSRCKLYIRARLYLKSLYQGLHPYHPSSVTTRLTTVTADHTSKTESSAATRKHAPSSLHFQHIEYHGFVQQPLQITQIRRTDAKRFVTAVRDIGTENSPQACLLPVVRSLYSCTPPPPF